MGEGSDLTPAIFGLIGVLVGGALNGLVAWGVELLHERRDARARMVLIAEELRGNLGVLVYARWEDRALPLRQITDAQWTKHQESLAGPLPRSTRIAVQMAYTTGNLGIRSLGSDDDDVLRSLDSMERQLIDPRIDLVAKGVVAADRWSAGWPRRMLPPASDMVAELERQLSRTKAD